jgi:hypothetical protein
MFSKEGFFTAPVACTTLIGSKNREVANSVRNPRDRLQRISMGTS